MGHADMQKALARLKAVGQREVGEPLPRLPQTKRKEKRTQYPNDPKWFHGEVK